MVSNPFKNLLGQEEEEKSLTEEACEACPSLTLQQVCYFAPFSPFILDVYFLISDMFHFIPFLLPISIVFRV